MKKIFKRLLAFSFALILISVPTTALAATPDDIYEDPLRQVKSFTYRSEPIMIQIGNSAALENNENNGLWHIEEGQTLTFHVNFAAPADCKFLIIRTDNNPELVYSSEYYTNSFSAGVPNLPEGNYQIILLPPYEAIGITFYLIDID